MKKKSVLVICVIAVAIIVIGAVMTMLRDSSASTGSISSSEAYQDLLRMVDKVDYTTVSVAPEQLDVSEFLSAEDELPDIDSSYPVVVQGSGRVDIEVFSSGEKASKSGKDAYLTDLVTEFNKAGYTTSSGASISVTLRSVPSGTAIDYITTGKYVPDLYSPSNELYKGLLEENGVSVEVADDSLVTNYAGIIVKNKVYSDLFGDAVPSMTDIVDAVSSGSMSMGYSNPYTSATGLNFLMTALQCYDPDNLLSDDATAMFETFQTHISIVSYTTQQLTSSAEKGIIDAMVCEYQSYVNSASLSKNYTFIPFGVIHSNPLYIVDTLSEDERDAVDAFVAYCDENSSEASDYGFNQPMSYTCSSSYTGKEISQAQTIYKEAKSSSKTIVAEFIVDTSGSMDGEPINNLKMAMKNSIQYIGDDSYIGVLTFNYRVCEYLPIDQFDLEQKTLFKGAVDTMDAAGSTYMYEAILCGLKNVREKCDELEAQGIETKPILFVLTDGDSNGKFSFSQTSDIIDGMNIPVYTISYNYSNDILGDLADLNEGAYINGTSEDIVYKLKQLFNSEM